jgi:substrate import-associated zinc metallohydrolase lipoprotein
MKMQKPLISLRVFFILGIILIAGCEREETLKPISIFEIEPQSTNKLDLYLKKEYSDPYGCTIIYKFIDLYIDPKKSAVPPRLNVVQPIAELIKQAWIEPYNKASDQGKEFLKTYFPAEIVLIGSAIYNGDGTIALGFADSGVRITLTQVNNYGSHNDAWILQIFRTIHHEFSHIINQNFNFDIEAFYSISDKDYTSPGTWVNLIEDNDEFGASSINNAITRGMVTVYGTSTVREDFAEFIARIITTDPVDFKAIYLTNEDCTDLGQDCLDRNIGRERIRQKYDIVVKYMKEDVGVDLFILRDEFLKNINQ